MTEEQTEVMSLGSAVRMLRQVKGWKQSQLADTIDIDRTYLSRIESDSQLPSIAMLQRIAEALEINPAFLIMLAHGSDPEIAPFIPLILDRMWATKNVRQFIMGMEG